MRQERIVSQPASEPWQVASVHGEDKRSLHAMQIIELAHTLAAAETAVLTGDEAKALADLKRLQAYASRMVADLERACFKVA